MAHKIIENEKDRKDYLFKGWGDMTFTLTDEEIQALKDGKEIGLLEEDGRVDEYAIILRREQK